MNKSFKLLGNENIKLLMETWDIGVLTSSDIYIKRSDGVIGCRLGEHGNSIAVQIFTLEGGTHQPLDMQTFSLSDYCPENYELDVGKSLDTFQWKVKDTTGEAGPPALPNLIEDINNYLAFWEV